MSLTHKDLAGIYSPTIYQAYLSDLDCITAIQLDKEEIVLARLRKIIADPVLYYAVQEIKGLVFINYLIYHPFDWSTHKIKFIKNWDEHRHDSESICLRINPNKGTVDILTMSHNSNWFDWNICADVPNRIEVVCEDRGHGIKPIGKSPLKKDKIYLTYYPHSYRLENMFEWPEKYYNRVVAEFNKHGVPWLDQQHDTTLKLQSFGKDPQHFDGDIILDPDKLFRLGEKYGR